MNDQRTISSRAASIPLGLDVSGRRFGTGSSVNQSISPYFNTGSHQPLADLTNFWMENKSKARFTCNVNIPSIIQGKEVSRHKAMKKSMKPNSSGVKGTDEDFFTQILKNMNEDMKKNPQLSLIGIPQSSRKRKNHCDEGSLKLIKQFKESMKEQDVSIKVRPTMTQVNEPPGQARLTSPRQEDPHLSLQSGHPQPLLSEKTPDNQGNSNISSRYESDDLFDPPNLLKERIPTSRLSSSRSPHLSLQSGLPKPPILEKMPCSLGYSNISSPYGSDDLFDPPNLLKKRIFTSPPFSSRSPCLSLQSGQSNSPILEKMPWSQNYSNVSCPYESDDLFDPPNLLKEQVSTNLLSSSRSPYLALQFNQPKSPMLEKVPCSQGNRGFDHYLETSDAALYSREWKPPGSTAFPISEMNGGNEYSKQLAQIPPQHYRDLSTRLDMMRYGPKFTDNFFQYSSEDRFETSALNESVFQRSNPGIFYQPLSDPENYPDPNEGR